MRYSGLYDFLSGGVLFVPVLIIRFAYEIALLSYKSAAAGDLLYLYQHRLQICASGGGIGNVLANTADYIQICPPTPLNFSTNETIF